MVVLLSCSDSGCIDADDYGEYESQTLVVRSRSLSSSNCKYNPSEALDSPNQGSDIRNCLTTGSKQFYTEAKELKQSNLGCMGFDETLKNICAYDCESTCLLNADNSSSNSEPNWISTSKKEDNKNIGVTIYPGSEIKINVRGNIKLGGEVPTGEIYLKVNSPDYGAYKSINGDNYPYDVFSGDSIKLKFDGKWNDGSQDLGIVNSSTTTTSSEFINSAKRVIAYVIPHPSNYDFDYSQSSEQAGTKKVPLMLDTNVLKCTYLSTGSNKEANCSGEDDDYIAAGYANASNSLASSAFDIGTDDIKITNYGGFIRKSEDDIKNKQYDPFLNTICDTSGVCENLPINDEGIIIGDLSSQYEYQNISDNTRSISFKNLSSGCNTVNILSVEIYNNSNQRKYRNQNLLISKGSWTQIQIDLYPGYKLKISSNSSTNNSGTNCGKFIAMRLTKYHQIRVQNSGFVSFKIIDSNSGSNSSDSKTCIIKGRIVNPNGTIPTIDQVGETRVYLGADTTSSSSNSQITIGTDPTGLEKGTITSSYGFSTFSSIERNSLTSTSCVANNGNTIISNKIKSECSSSSCSLSFDNSSFNFTGSICSNGDGTIGSNSKLSEDGGSGGGGGGNSGGSGGQMLSAGIPGASGSTGSSYYHPEISSVPTKISYSGSDTSGVGGLSGSLGGDGYVILYNSSNVELARKDVAGLLEIQSIAIPSDNIIKYKIRGGGGGGGGGGDGTLCKLGGSGANGDYLEGSINLSKFKESSINNVSLKLYSGGGGSFGSTCYIGQSIQYELNSPATVSLQAPSGYLFNEVDFASYGLPTIKQNSFQVNPECHSSNSYFKIMDPTVCYGRSSCSITVSDAFFEGSGNNLTCNNGNGGDGYDAGAQDGAGGGGGGGGNGYSEGGLAGPESYRASAGLSGFSYYNPYNHYIRPTISNPSSSNAGSPGNSGLSGSALLGYRNISNVYVSLINSSSSGESSVTIPNGVSSIEYELTGAGGGGGGSNPSSGIGGSGASGSKISGTLVNMKPGEIIKVYIGGGGNPGTTGSGTGGGLPNSTISIFKGGRGGHAGTTNSSGGGGAGGGATLISVDKKILAIAGGGGGGGGGTINQGFSATTKTLYSDLNENLNASSSIHGKYFAVKMRFLPSADVSSTPPTSGGSGFSGNYGVKYNTNENLTLTTPSGYVFSKVNFISYGTPDINNTTYSVNSSCNNANAKSKVIETCIGGSSCTITNNDSFFGINSCANGNGLVGEDVGAADGGGGGGGGGGNSQAPGGLFGDERVAGKIPGGGISGSSYYDRWMHTSTPSISTGSSGGGNQTNGTNGNVILRLRKSSSPTSTQIYNSSTPIATSVTISDATGTSQTEYFLEYEISGAGGGGGGNDGGIGGSGASGAKITGTIKNIKLGDIIKIYVGGAGGRGVGCSANSGKGIASTAAGIFLGANGGNAGQWGCSGGGGAGGGASAISLGNRTLVIAGGGGGGGGGELCCSAYSATPKISSSDLTYILKAMPIGNYLAAKLDYTSASSGGSGIISGEENEVTTDNMVGTSSFGSFQAMKCPPDQFVKQFSGTISSNYIQSISITCSDNTVLGPFGGASSNAWSFENANGFSKIKAKGGSTYLDSLEFYDVVTPSPNIIGNVGLGLNGSSYVDLTCPTGKILGLKIQYDSSFVRKIGVLCSSNDGVLNLNAPSGVINDIVFASYGKPNSANFTIDPSCHSQLSEDIVRNNCVGYKSCNIDITNQNFGDPCPGQTKKLLVKYTYGPDNAISITTASGNIVTLNSKASTTSPILRGGDGGVNSSSSSSCNGGGGGAGGGGSAISILRNDISTNGLEDFVVIAGGGGGGGGGGCSFAGSNANSISTNPSDSLINNILRKRLGVTINYTTARAVNVPENFYEFYDFSTTFDPTEPTYNDPMENLQVSTSNFTTKKIFVRKGQSILFSPESWDGSWKTKDNLIRQCGVGMFMKVDPQPAVLCLNTKKSTATINNPNCIVDVQTINGVSQVVGCQAVSSQCDTKGGSSYCLANCRHKINCTNGSSTAPKTNCSSSAPSSTDCSQYLDGTSSSSCSNCASAMISSAQQSPISNISNLIECFDLEEFTGKVANIPTDPNSANYQTKINELITNNKLKTLDFFNGSYGSLYSSKISPTFYTESLTFNKNGRLKFAVIDRENFRDINSGHSNNTSPTSNYLKFNIGKNLDFANGKFLEIRLCKESDVNGTACNGSNPTQISSQPKVSEITNLSSIITDNLIPNYQNYNFDENGNIKRVSSLTTGDCLIGTASYIITEIGSNFYCHTQDFRSASSMASLSKTDLTNYNNELKKLRLSFKIRDPDPFNCKLLLSSTNNDGYMQNNGGSNPGVCYQSDNPCTKEYICKSDKYKNNSGEYLVTVRSKKPISNTASDIIKSVIKPIIEIFDGKLDDPFTPSVNESTMGEPERFYKLLINNANFYYILRISTIMMITFYGLGFLIGVSELKLSELIKVIIKIGVVYLFLGPTGWYWFNLIFVNVFKAGTNYIAFLMASTFDNSPGIINALSSTNLAEVAFYDKSLLFSSSNKVINLIFSDVIMKKIAALTFSSIFGWLYVIIIFYGIITYIFAIANAVLLFLTAQIFISILFVLGPFFFLFLLFNQTKEMFDNWIKNLIGFSLQQIFLATTLAFFNLIFYQIIKLSLGYKICWESIWTINLYITRVTLFSFWKIGSLPPSDSAEITAGTIGSPAGIPSIFSIAAIYFVASLMNHFIKFMTDVASKISDGLSATSLSSGVSDAATSAKTMAIKLGSSVYEKTLGRAVGYAQYKLLDYGDYAESKRKERMQENDQNMSYKAEMKKAGNEAINKYKTENAGKLSLMNENQQRNTLKNVRDQAMMQKGIEMGLGESKARDLINERGIKFEGNSLGELLMQAGKQATRDGGTLFNSLDDRGVKTSLTNDQAVDAMKDMLPTERENFMKSIKDGSIQVDKSNYKKLKSVAKNALNVVKNPTRSARKGIYNLASGASKKMSKAVFGSKETTEARKQLESEGKIDTLSAGSNYMLRSKEERQMIKERARENKENKEQGLPKINDQEVISSMENEKKILDNRDNRTSRKLTSASNQSKDQTIENLEKKVKKSLKDNNKKISSKQSEIDKLNQRLEAQQSKIDSDETSKNIDMMSEKLNHLRRLGGLSKMGTKKQLEKDLEKMKSTHSGNYRDIERKNKIKSRIKQLENEIDILNQRGEKIANLEDNIKVAKNIKQKAEERIVDYKKRSLLKRTLQRLPANIVPSIKAPKALSFVSDLVPKKIKKANQAINSIKDYDRAKRAIDEYNKLSNAKDFENYAKQFKDFDDKK